MKNLFLLLVLMIATLCQLHAQTGELMIKKGSKGLYLDHKVAPKEGLYSIGRLYNVNPKFIAAYNEIDLNKGLNIGQTVKIPLTDTNFNQKSKKGSPVYYTVGENENLVKVSNANNKVLLKELRSWNKLTNDIPAAGTKLIVGFLVSSQAPVASTATTNTVKQPEVKKGDNTSVTTKSEKETVKTKSPSQKPVEREKPAEEKPIVKTEPEKEKPTATEIKEQSQKTEPVFTSQDVGAVNPDQGYFKKSYEQQVKASPASKNNTVTGGIFKTTSGWQDGKYYLLIDGVATGTIVKIINPENNKAVYAKVLGQMNGIRQNEGLDIRISNAAAVTLGIADTEKFIVKVNY